MGAWWTLTMSWRVYTKSLKENGAINLMGKGVEPLMVSPG